MKWLRYLLWNPLELLFTQFPLVPLRVEEVVINNEIRQIKIYNLVTVAISKIGGGYDYSVMYMIGNKMLFDTGFSWAKKSFRRHLLAKEYDTTIDLVVNSHAHEDHIGNNDIIEQFTQATIYAHPLAVPIIKHPPKLPWYRSFMFGSNTYSQVTPIPNSLKFDNFDFEVIHTPGHSKGHICLYEKNNKWLFSGDLYVAPDLDSQLQDVNGPEWIHSLENILTLEVNLLLDGHGLVVEGKNEINSLLQEKLSFLKAVRNKVHSVAQQPMHLDEITKKVFSDKSLINRLSFNDGWLSILTNSDFSRTNLIRSFLNHPESNENEDI